MECLQNNMFDWCQSDMIRMSLKLFLLPAATVLLPLNLKVDSDAKDTRHNFSHNTE